jgi:hypothetical protein
MSSHLSTMMAAPETSFKTQEALMIAWEEREKEQEERAEQQEKQAIRLSCWEA